MGDFNCLLEAEDKKNSNMDNLADFEEPLTVVSDCGLADLLYSGFKYTWSNEERPSKYDV